MKTYKRIDNHICDESGKQVATVLATNCSMKLARQMAAYCVEKLNVEALRKERLKQWEELNP